MLSSINNKIHSFVIMAYKKIVYRKKLILHNNINKILLKNGKNIIIRNGVLEINDNLDMSYNSRITVTNGGKVLIKGNCSFNTNSICVSMGKVTIGKNVAIGPNVCIYDHDHRFNENGKMDNEYSKGEIVIGNNVWIGAGCIILKNTIIGDNSIIGAGSIIKGNIPNNSLVTSDRKTIIKKLESKNDGKKNKN